MSAALTLALALLVQPAPTQAPQAVQPPELRVAIHDLDFTRPADLDAFASRVRSASRAFCNRHLELVTPERLGDSSVCRAEMRRLAYRALPETRRLQIADARRFRVVR